MQPGLRRSLAMNAVPDEALKRLRTQRNITPAHFSTLDSESEVHTYAKLYTKMGNSKTIYTRFAMK